MKGTHKHMETSLKCFDNHRCLSQAERKCIWTHGKEVPRDCHFWSRTICDCWNISLKLLCVCVCLSSRYLFIISVLPLTSPIFVLSVPWCFPFPRNFYHHVKFTGITRMCDLFENTWLLQMTLLFSSLEEDTTSNNLA